MALIDKSFFRYGFQVTNLNNVMPLINSVGGTEIDAFIPPGNYTLLTLCNQIAISLNLADPANTYTCFPVRGQGAHPGQDAVWIQTSGTSIGFLWGSSPLTANVLAPLIGFEVVDNLGGVTHVQSSVTPGTILTTSWYGKNYQRPDANLRTIGSSNISATGLKEVIWWSVQQFIQVEFQYEAQAYVISSWLPFLQWMAKGLPFEFTPEMVNYNTVYSVTLDKSTADSKGLGIMMKEMIPDFPFQYQTGLMEFRLLPGTY